MSGGVPGIDGGGEDFVVCILALITEPTVARAAESAGVSESTVHRWLLEETFGKAFRRARRETFGQAIALAQRYTPLAVNNLAKIMNDLATAASARVAGCASTLWKMDAFRGWSRLGAGMTCVVLLVPGQGMRYLGRKHGRKANPRDTG